MHNAGEVWATALFECYVSLLREAPRLSFLEAQKRMKSYLVAGLKLTPPNPTFLEGRDALLAAMRANDLADFGVCAQAFARRGFGSLAVAPSRNSRTNSGAVESFALTSNVGFVDASLSETPMGACDHDGILDAGETGALTLSLQNTGWQQTQQVSATLSSTAAGVSFPAGGSVTFPAMAAGAVLTLQIPVSLGDGLATNALVPFTVTYVDASTGQPAKTETLQFRVNRDEAPGTAHTETVDTGSVLGAGVWTASRDTT